MTPHPGYGLKWRCLTTRHGCEKPPNTFAILGRVLHFYRPYNYRICECRPVHYAVASVLGNWGVPVFSDHVLYMDMQNLLGRRVSHPPSAIGGDDIFLLIGLCATWAEVQDFRQTAARRSIRYVVMIVPSWLRDGAESAMWASRTALDASLAGDPLAGTWSAYASGGIQGAQFDLAPSNAEIRTLKYCYRLAGLT